MSSPPVLQEVYYLAEQIKAAVADRPEVILQHEAEVLGTGGGLRRALDRFTDGPVLVMNSDIYHDIDLHSILQAHAATDFSVTMALHDYPRFNSVQVQGNRICGFLPGESDENPTDLKLLAFTGIHVVNREVIEQIPADCFFHIIDLYQKLAQAGQIGWVPVDGCFWQDIGTPADYLALHRYLLSSRMPAWHIHESAVIGKNVELKDWGAIGPGAVIGDGAQLTRCVVWEEACITAGTHLTDMICSSDSSVKS